MGSKPAAPRSSLSRAIVRCPGTARRTQGVSNRRRCREGMPRRFGRRTSCGFGGPPRLVSLRRRKPDYDQVNENVNGTRRARKRSSEPREPLNLRVRPATLDQLRTYASSKGVSAPRLAASLLEKIAEDDLYKAVLDDN